jgi:ABC-type transport system involved in cytochrome c biogenesis permease component
VELGVNVFGWKFVAVAVGVSVIDGVGVTLGVSVMEGVKITGVLLTEVRMGVMVPVMVGVGVKSCGLGAKDRKTRPAQ